MKLKLLLAGILISKISLSQVPSYVPTNGLVGWWSFTGNANDNSGNNNNGTTYGVTLTADRFGNNNSAYNFNGTTSYIQIPHSASLTFTGNQISISYWVNISSFSGNPSYNKIAISKQNGDGTTQTGFNVWCTSGAHGLRVRNGAGGNFGGAGNNLPISLSTWVHVVYVWDGVNGFFYQNGVPINSNSILNAAIGANTLPLLFGKPNWTNVNAEPFDGKLDDIAIFNRPLTACEVSELYQSQVLSSSGTDIVSTCNSYTWIDGNTYTSSNNTATHVLTNVVGCDSTVTLNLTINNSNTGIDIVTACNSYTWIDGNTYNSSTNTATYTLTNVAGCDSIVTLNLTINSSSTGTDVVDACDTYTWIDGITYTSNNSSATYILQNSHGCDSLVTLNLTLNNSSSSTLNETTLDSYTLNGQTYTQSGTYIQTLTNSQGCDSTITLNLDLEFTGLNEMIVNSITVYPNPAIESITIESESFNDVFVLDLLGNIIIQEIKNDIKKIISLINLSSGTYFIRQDASIFKFIKQ